MQGGPYLVANRVNGASTIDQSLAQFSANTFSGNVTVGSGLSGIGWDNANVIASGFTLTNNSPTLTNVVEVSDSKTRMPGQVQIRNNNSLVMETAAGGLTTAGILNTKSDNLQIRNTGAGKAIQGNVSATGLYQWLFNGVEIVRFSPTGIALVDGATAPSTVAGFAQMYVDTADGDLKVKFGDGTIKTIVTDT